MNATPGFQEFVVVFDDSRAPELPIMARGFEEAKHAAWRMTHLPVIAVALRDDVSAVVLSTPVDDGLVDDGPFG